MQLTRRDLIRQAGLALIGISIPGIEAFALPDPLSTPGVGDNITRLSSNENPYGPSPVVREAMKSSIGISNRYQWQMIRDLMSSVASANNVKAENVLIGAGSTHIIDCLLRYVSAQPGNFIIAHPTFDRWADAAERSGLKKVSVPLTPDKKHNLQAMLKAITPQTRMVYLCNPNNPTGTVCQHDELVSFVKEAAKQTVVLVDEAYLDYSGEPSLSNQIGDNANLIVVKTFSKIHGLAGARIGYALAQEKTIDKLSGILSGANMDLSAVSLAAALASLKDKDFVKDSYLKNEKARAYTIAQLERLSIPVIPSHTNFIYFSLANYKKDFFGLLKQNNIEGTGYFEEDGKWTRITVGTMGEMEKFVGAVA